MSLTAITTPSSPAGTYDFEALKYQWADQYAYTAIADSGGNLQLTVASGTASEFSAGEFLWVSALVGFDLVDSPIVEILSVGATTITLDTAYNAGYSATGTIRGTKALNFVIQSGFGTSAQPLRQRILSMRPDPDGVYNLNPYQEVISRFAFREPTLGSSGQDDNSVRYRAYPESAGTGTLLYAFKGDSGSTVASVIRYAGVPNIVSYIPSGGVRVLSNLESDASTELDSAGTIETETDVFAFDCTTYTFTFSAPFDEGFVTFTPQDWVTVNVSGALVQSVVFDFNGQSAGEYTWQIEYDDGANTKVFTFTIYVQNTIDCRPSCGGRRFFWWSIDGGWCSYEFSLAVENEIVGGGSQLKQVDNVISAVRYEQQQQQLSLIAQYEGETVYDYLRKMLFALNVYEATTFTDVSQVYDVYYLYNANGQRKRSQPYLATSNRFTVDLLRGTIENRINEGR